MYYRYFGLQEEPFSIAVNPKYLFMSARHRDALAHLLYGVGTGGGFILLTGEVGTGKTTINRCLMQQLPSETDVAIILNPALNAEELLASVCDELHIDYPRDNCTLKTLTDALHAFLLENHGRGRNTVLLIDEAQHLKFEVLEQIRLLTNLETNTRKLLQIILVGQPELTALLAKPELRQLNQRITARYNLKPLNLVETDAYIRHRLQVAGLPANQELFPRSVVKGIHRRTRGIPRLINILCDRVLLGTYGQNKAQVDASMLRQAAAEVLGEQEAVRLESARNPWAYAALLAVVVLGVLAYQGWRQAQRSDAIAVSSRVQADVPVSVPVSVPQPVAPEIVEPVVMAERFDEVVVAPVVADESTVVESPLAWFGDESIALAELARYMGVADLPLAVDCVTLQQLGWRCEKRSAATWNELLVYNRPTLLSVVTPERFAAQAMLVGVDGRNAELWHNAGPRELSLLELGRLWQGAYLFLWQPPPGYTAAFIRGYTGPEVAWLAREFAALDGQTTPLAQDQFSDALDQRVRLFQRRHGLLDDGVVGLKTLLKLSEMRGQSQTLTVTPPAVADMEVR